MSAVWVLLAKTKYAGARLFKSWVGKNSRPRLLRVLQEGEIQRVGDTKTQTVDVRVIAATNRDLVAAVRDGTMRDDLFGITCASKSSRRIVSPGTSAKIRARVFCSSRTCSR